MKERLIELARYAFLWGADWGSNRSDKNFNDFLDTTTFKENYDSILSLIEEQKRESYIIGYDKATEYFEEQLPSQIELETEAYTYAEDWPEPIQDSIADNFKAGATWLRNKLKQG